MCTPDRPASSPRNDCVSWTSSQTRNVRYWPRATPTSSLHRVRRGSNPERSRPSLVGSQRSPTRLTRTRTRPGEPGPRSHRADQDRNVEHPELVEEDSGPARSIRVRLQPLDAPARVEAPITISSMRSDRLARETAPLRPLGVVGAKRSPRSMPSPVARASSSLRRFSTALRSRSLRSDLDWVSGTPTWWCISADTTGGWNPPSSSAPGLGESGSILGTSTNRSVSSWLTIKRRSHLGSKCSVTTVSTFGSPSARYPDVESWWTSSSER